MSKNMHDFAFKELMTNKIFFVDFCQSYLPEEIKSRVNWDTIKLYKMNTEFIEKSATEDKQRDRHADIIYSLKYDDSERECMICVHVEHQATVHKLMSLRFLNYNSSLLVEYAETNPDQPLPIIVSLIYYQGKWSPYPYSLDVFDLFEDKELARRYLLEPLLIDLKQLPDEELERHRSIFPMEALFKLAFEEALTSSDYDLFLKAIVQQKDNQYVLEHLGVFLKYATNALKCDYKEFAQRFIETLPELEDTMLTMAEQLKEEGMQQGMQEMARNIAKSLLKQGIGEEIIAESSGLTIAEIKSLARQIDSDENES